MSAAATETWKAVSPILTSRKKAGPGTRNLSMSKEGLLGCEQSRRYNLNTSLFPNYCVIILEKSNRTMKIR